MLLSIVDDRADCPIEKESQRELTKNQHKQAQTLQKERQKNI